MLLVADVHLGYAWAQRRRGELGPLADCESEDKLLTVAAEFQPRTILFLGDLVHAPNPGAEERQGIESTLRRLAAGCRLVLVKGNHDRAFERDFASLGLEVVTEWRSPGLMAVHGNEAAKWPRRSTLALGHLHPSARLFDRAGVSHRLPAFLSGRRAIVLPAFSPFAGGFNIGDGLPAGVARLFRGETPLVAAVTGKRVVRLNRRKAP